ncbi:hypothetical protein [Paenibacillus sp. AR247]|uniref:hypothetical protein n=1 Tax=Paenibacillus sp. AR247 TaxID=1631599 RepID=UPI000CFA4206|nr:hypothetical protein [Paenibacillus sp. AR247]PQP91205.1 hypothetical protein CPT76_01285 [Paenibacillus sp. AR247]
MEWWRIFILILVWAAACMVFISALNIKRGQAKGIVTDVMSLWPVTDTIAGNVASTIFSFIAGLVFKHFPWWLLKLLLYLLSALLFCLGIMFTIF